MSLKCSFCGSQDWAVLISNPKQETVRAFICDDCIQVSVHIMTAKLREWNNRYKPHAIIPDPFALIGTLPEPPTSQPEEPK